MIHKFVANDNKGNVNVLEVTSTGTKLGKVAAPVEDTDAATKKYVDDNTGVNNKFIVTLTPTSPDFSGTMDKTVAEINAAYDAGMEIWFTIADYTAPCAVVAGTVYPHFFANVFDLRSNTLMVAYTDSDQDGTDTSYGVAIYTLTPAS